MYIKSFSDFVIEKNENKLLEKIWQEWLSEHADNNYVFEELDASLFEEDIEDEDDISYHKLTSGEKAALARDQQILSEPQLAAIYLKTLGIIENDPNKFMKLIQGENGNILDFADEKGKWTNAALADAIGLNSDYTVSRTIGKFKNIITGVGHIEQDVLYPKIIKAYEKFKKMNLNEIGIIAGKALQSKENSTARDMAEIRNKTIAQTKLQKKKEIEKFYEQVYDLEKKLRIAFPKKSKEEIIDWSIKKIIEEKNLQHLDLTKIKKNYIKWKIKNNL